jgi:hypothetical protein
MNGVWDQVLDNIYNEAWNKIEHQALLQVRHEIRINVLPSFLNQISLEVYYQIRN